MNYVDWKHASEFGSFNTNAEYLYNRLTACKIPVAVMEPLLGGRLAQYNYETEQIKISSEITFPLIMATVFPRFICT